MQEYAQEALIFKNNELPSLKQAVDLLQCPKTKGGFQLDSIVNKYDIEGVLCNF